MSESKKGKVLTEEHKEKLSKAMKGKPSKLKGRIFTEEERRIAYKTRMGKRKKKGKNAGSINF